LIKDLLEKECEACGWTSPAKKERAQAVVLT